MPKIKDGDIVVDTEFKEMFRYESRIDKLRIPHLRHATTDELLRYESSGKTTLQLN